MNVRGQDDSALFGAVVRAMLVREGRAYLAGAANADSSGQVTFAGLPAGDFIVLAFADGRARSSMRVTLDEGTARELSFRLAPDRGLVVDVTDDQAEPVGHARLEVRADDVLAHTAETGSDGHVAVGRLGTAPWQVRVAAAGYEPVSLWVSKSEVAPLAVTLRRLGALEVAIVDADGRPQPGAELTLVGSGLSSPRRARADRLGRAHAADLSPGSYDLRAVSGARAVGTELGVRVARGETRSLALVVRPGRRVEVSVFDGDGDDARPVPLADVVFTEGGLSRFPLEARTGQDGTVELGPADASGDGYLAVWADGFVPKRGVLVRAGTEGLVRVALVRGGALEGDVVDARGFPVAGATIEVIGTGPSGEPIDDTPELISFRASHFGAVLPAPRPFWKAGDLGVMPGPLAPIPPVPAAPPPDRAPRLGAPLDAPATGPGWRPAALAPPEPWVTRSDGSFVASPVSEGTIRAIVRHPAYVEETSEPVVLLAGKQAHVRVVLRSGGILEGRVRDERREPVSGVRLSVRSTRGAFERSTITDAGGAFAFASVPPEVAVWAGRPETPGDLALLSTLHVAEGERKHIELVLAALREALRVQVLDPRGAPLAGVRVALQSFSTDDPLQKVLATDREGLASFADAAGRSLRIEAALAGYAPVAQEIAAAPAEIVLRMSSGITVVGRVTSRGGHDAAGAAEVTLAMSAGTVRGRADGEGVFKLQDVAEGRGRLSVWKAGYAPVERDVEVAAPARADRPFELAPMDLPAGGDVEGLVVDAFGEPVAGARVVASGGPLVASGGPLGALAPERQRVARTDRAGGFLLESLPEGSLTLMVAAPKRGKGSAVVEVHGGRATRDVRITLAEETAPRDEPNHPSVAPGGPPVAPPP